MLVLWAAIIGLNAAYALDVTRQRDGEWVVVTAELPHATATIRNLLRQDAKTMSIGSGVRSVKTKPLPNGCTQVEVANNGLGRNYSYTAERCAIENGWHSKMTSSPDFKDHQIIWETVPSDGGSQVTIRVKVEPKFPVPRFIMTRVVGGALAETLEKMDAMLAKSLGISTSAP